jgi:xylan 1,4-beta-xylosidase
MRGDPDSCGVWAPCLTHHGGLFYLVYTDVKRYGRSSAPGAAGGSLRDFHNYLVTSATVEGEWSDPVYLNSSGFDPSLFHDDDGRKYLVNMLWDHRAGHNRFAGIVLQEYSAAQQRLIGERQTIFPGTAIGFTEAPHLYKRNGWYYLLTAEGGTGWGHAATLARSRTLRGPYELHPDIYILTTRHRPDAPLQRAGHADLVDTPTGETYMVYLCGRPLPNRGRCTLGRETAIQPMTWGDDGWLRTTSGDGAPMLEAPAPRDVDVEAQPVAPPREDFDTDTLRIDFQWLRTPDADRLFSLRARKGHLRLFGRESIGSLFTQSLVARRQQAHCFGASTLMEYEPDHFQQMAGLVCYYNSAKFHYFYVSRDTTGKHLRVMSAFPDQVMADAFTPPIAIAPGVPIELRVEVDYERLLFAWRAGSGPWQWLPQVFDASILSDEATAPGLPNFTGAFVGMACQDLAGTAMPADFDWFEYREREYVPTIAR